MEEQKLSWVWEEPGCRNSRSVQPAVRLWCGLGTSGQDPVCCLREGLGQEPPAERKYHQQPGLSGTHSDPALTLVPACVQASGQTKAGIRLPG